MAHNLADETWATILEHILEVPDDDFISCETSSGPFSRRDHSNADVLLVCKRWLRIATPLVFHTCIIRSTAQAQALAKALKKSPEFGVLIKQLRLEGCYGASVPNILEKATRLEDLAISLPATSKDNGKPMFTILDTLTPRRLIVCNWRRTSNAQATFALTALRSFIKKCDTLNALVLVLPFIRGRTLLSELAASPSSILKITTCNHCPRDDDYQTVSGLFNTLQSLRTVEFLIRTHSKYHTAPSDETLIKIGERIMLRIQSERSGISLGEYFKQRDERSLASVAASIPSSGVPALSHVPKALQYSVWTRVLYYACKCIHLRHCILNLVCRMFLNICTRHRLQFVMLVDATGTLRATRMLERAVATNPITSTVVRLLNLGDAAPGDDIHSAGPPIHLLRTVIHHCSQLTAVTCWRMSIEIFLLLASVNGQSLLQLAIPRVCKEEPRSERVVVRLHSLRRLWIGSSSDYKVSASDWSSVVIHTPSLLELELLEDGLTVASLLPSLIRGRLPLLRRLAVSRQDSTSSQVDNREGHVNFIAAHGAGVTECTVPMDLVASVVTHCHALEQLYVGANNRQSDQATLYDWRAAFQTTIPLTNLRQLDLHATLLTQAFSETELEEVPDLFSRNLFPVLNDIQIRSFRWPQTSGPLQHEPKVALAIAWSERFAKMGIRVVDELGHKWRPRLATTQSHGRQAKRAR